MVELQTQELEVNERSLQLQKAMLHATDCQKSNHQKSKQVESPIATEFDTAISPCASPKSQQSQWLQFLESGLVLRPTI